MSEILYESQRIVATNTKEKIKITKPADIENIKQVMDIKDKVQEHFIVITLNVHNVVKSIELVGKGSMACVQVDISDVVRCAILRGATSIILAHNHPSGDVTPSKQDIYFTKRLNTVASYLNIKLLDHLIIGERTLSMAKENLIDMDGYFQKLENSVIDELKKENKELRAKMNESISKKISRAKEKAKEQKLNSRSRDPLKIERNDTTL